MNISSSLSTAMLCGYSVFTTFTVENNAVKGFSHHVSRLQENAKILFGVEISSQRIVTEIIEYIKKENLQHSLLRVAVYPNDFSLVTPGDISSCSFVITHRPVSVPNVKTDLTLQLHEMIRPLANLKTSALFPALQTRALAQKNGYADALFFHEGLITEGPTWNIIFGKGDTLFLPSPSHKTFLEGFTQQLLTEYLPASYTVEYRDIAKEDISQFEYACITSGGVGVIPIAQINNCTYSVDEVSALQDIYASIPAEEISL